MPTPCNGCCKVLKLRGGADSLVTAVQRSFLGVPLATRSWLALILGLAALAQAGVLSEELMALDAALVIQKMQWWRPVTAASFLGGVGPQLLQKLYYLVSFGSQLENVLGFGEYVRTIVSIMATMSFVCHVLGWPLGADGIIMAITVLTTQQRPDDQVSMYGLNIPLAYLPFAQLGMSYLFNQQQIPWVDIGGLFVGYFHYYMNDNLKPDSVVVTAPASTGPARRPGGRTLGSGGGKPAKKKAGTRKIPTFGQDAPLDASSLS